MMSSHLNRLRTELSRLDTFLAEAPRHRDVDRYRLVDLRRRSAALREQLWSTEVSDPIWRPAPAEVRRRRAG